MLSGEYRHSFLTTQTPTFKLCIYTVGIIRNFLNGNHQITDLSWIKGALVQPTDHKTKIKHQLILKPEKVHRFSVKSDP